MTWLGAVVAGLIAMVLVANADNLVGVIAVVAKVDTWCCGSCGIAMIGFGLIFSLIDGWGFFKHWWVVVKWVIGLVAPTLGGILISSSMTKLTTQAAALGAQAAWADPAFQSVRQTAITGQVISLVLLVVAAVLAALMSRRGLNPRPAAS